MGARMVPSCSRSAISRASLFADLASKCRVDQREEYEAFLEAAIVFLRAALHRWKNSPMHEQVLWDSIKHSPSIMFVIDKRNILLKESHLAVTQIISFGDEGRDLADRLYCFELGESAVETIRRHLFFIKAVVEGGDKLSHGAI